MIGAGRERVCALHPDDEIAVGTVISGDYFPSSKYDAPRAPANRVEEASCSFCGGSLYAWPDHYNLSRLVRIEVGATTGRRYGVWHPIGDAFMLVGCPACQQNFIMARDSRVCEPHTFIIYQDQRFEEVEQS